jgi:hypothetical protein
MLPDSTGDDGPLAQGEAPPRPSLSLGYRSRLRSAQPRPAERRADLASYTRTIRRTVQPHRSHHYTRLVPPNTQINRDAGKDQCSPLETDPGELSTAPVVPGPDGHERLETAIATGSHPIGFGGMSELGRVGAETHSPGRVQNPAAQDGTEALQEAI